MYICISAYLHICISAYLHICISAYLHICISAYLHICISAYLHICISAYLHICISAYLHRALVRMMYSSHVTFCRTPDDDAPWWAMEVFPADDIGFYRWNIRTNRYGVANYCCIVSRTLLCGGRAHQAITGVVSLNRLSVGCVNTPRR